MSKLNRMVRVTRTGVLLAFLVSGFAAGTAVADEETGTNDLEAWGSVNQDELGETRGAGAIADIDADIHQEYNGDANAGTISMDGGVMEPSMSIISINSGNNVVMLNTLALDICIECTGP